MYDTIYFTLLSVRTQTFLKRWISSHQQLHQYGYETIEVDVGQFL